MNIFYLDANPELAAFYHCDKHVVKMILETAQMLCAAHHLKGDGIAIEHLYKLTHKNHPSTVWVCDGAENYKWAYKLFCYLCDEYTYRYNKTHLTDKKFREYLKNIPINIDKNKKFIQPPQCMPQKYQHKDAVIGYRNYYINEKGYMLKYKNRNEPEWLKDPIYE